MRNLIEFILKYKYWFVFILMEAFSLSLLFRFNDYHASVAFTTANRLTGDMYATVDGVTSYVGLREENEMLEAVNESLRMEIHAMKRELAQNHVDTLNFNGFERGKYRLRGAQVINSTTFRSSNLMTINKGEDDGIRPEMGVISSSGAVGIVFLTSSRYSIVMPLINVNSKISCRLRSSNVSGTMEWKQGDPESAYMVGVPLHIKPKKGEWVESNGFSDIFPSGIPIGRVESVQPSADGLSHTIKLKLSVDFASVRNVSIILNYSHPEKRVLEQLADSLMME